MKTRTIDLSAIAGANIPHLGQHTGVWAMMEDRATGMLSLMQRLNWNVHLANQVSTEGQARHASMASRQYERDGDIAVIDITGMLTKFTSSVGGGGGASTVALRRAVRDAVDDPAVKGIMLRIDSPGGTVAGTEDLADEVAAAGKVKPVHAFAEDLCASAAYWIASQASRIVANCGSALVGSIGTYVAVSDFSRLADMEGVKVHVIRAGEFKGAGTPGTAVTDDQLAEFQRIVNESNARFLAGVARGRRMSKAAVEAIADGRVHVGKGAVQAGLIDGIERFDVALDSLRSVWKGESDARMDETAARFFGAGRTYASLSAAEKNELMKKLSAELDAKDDAVREAREEARCRALLERWPTTRGLNGQQIVERQKAVGILLSIEGRRLKAKRRAEAERRKN